MICCDTESGLLSSPHALLNLDIHIWLIRRLLNRLVLTVTFGTRHSIALKIVCLSLLKTLCTNVYFHIISVGKFIFTLINAITSDIISLFFFLHALVNFCIQKVSYHSPFSCFLKLSDSESYSLFFHIAFGS